MIGSIYEEEQLRRLNEKKLVIETFYSRGNKQVFVRASDGLMQEDISNAPIIEKRYFFNNECIHVETNFNQDIIYNLNSIKSKGELISCPNCGHEDKLEFFSNGCPYCKTKFNIGINQLNFVRSTKEKEIFIIPKYLGTPEFGKHLTTILLLLFFDIFFGIGSLVYWFSDDNLFYVLIFIPIIISIVLIIKIRSLIKYIKKRSIEYKSTNLAEYGNRILPWIIDKDEAKFYSSLNNNLALKFYEINKEVIDLDLLKYLNLDFISENEVKVRCLIREVYFKDKIESLFNTYDITLKFNGDFNTNDYKIIKCSRCGASIDAKSNKCEFCGKKIETSSWSIVEMNKILN